MNPKQLRLILLGLLAISLVAFMALAVFGTQMLSGQSQKLVDLKLQNKTADNQLASLSQVKKQVEQYAYFNDVAKTVVPNDKDQAQAVLDIFHLADQSGIAVASVTFPTSTLGVKSSTSTEQSATGSASNALSQAQPVKGISGVYSLELTITPQTGPQVPAAKAVTYHKLLGFLNRVEHDRRTAQITQVNIQPQGSTTGPSDLVNFILTINIFIKP